MAEVTAYSLLTLAEGLEALNLEAGCDEEDAVKVFINGVSEAIERYCGRDFKTRSYTETFSGGGSNRYLLRDGLNTTVVSEVICCCLDETGETTVPSDNIKYNARIGEVYLTGGYAFARGFENCQVTYTAGLAAIPESLKVAARMLLKDWWNIDEKQMQVVSSITMEGQTINYDLTEIPRRVKAILDRWVRHRIA